MVEKLVFLANFSTLKRGKNNGLRQNGAAIMVQTKMAWEKWCQSKMEPVKNGADQKWSRSKMEPVKNGAVQKWSRSKMKPIMNDADTL